MRSWPTIQERTLQMYHRHKDYSTMSDDSKTVEVNNVSGHLPAKPTTPKPVKTTLPFHKPEGDICAIDDFIGDSVVLDYLLDKILLKGFLYCLTGPTGTGKTAIALLLGLSVATGRNFAGQATTKGRVLYCAGENPLDVKMRLIAATDELGIDPKQMHDTFHIQEGTDSSMGQILIHARNNQYDLIIIDTLPAYFQGEDSNSNDQVKAFARDRLRPFCELQQTPTVLALCHPVKSPSKDFNVPYGGGALLNEVDGNLGLWGASDEPKELYVCKKMRGAPFHSLYFRMKETTHPKITDSKGQLVSTVIAAHIDEAESEKLNHRARNDENELMASMLHHPKMNNSKRARHLKWFLGSGKPNGQHVGRVFKVLEKDRLVSENREGWFLTKTGREAAHHCAKKEAYDC